MLGLAVSLGCPSTDVACLCANQNFGYGVRDCSAQACPPGTDLSGISQYALQYCGSPAASKSSSLELVEFV
jgi:CFEM domain